METSGRDISGAPPLPPAAFSKRPLKHGSPSRHRMEKPPGAPSDECISTRSSSRNTKTIVKQNFQRFMGET